MPRLAVVAASSFALALLLPANAHAQFGGLVRRAAERVVNKEKPSGQPQIDGDVVTHMLSGLTEEARVADSIGRAALAGNAEVIGQVDGFLKRYATWSTAAAASRRAQQEYQDCVEAPARELTGMAQAQQASASPEAMAFAQRMASMSDEESEAFQAKMEKLNKEAEAAQKSGNVAEQQRIRTEVERLTGMKMKAPSAAEQRRNAANVKKAEDAGNRIEQCKRPTLYAGRPPEPIMVRPVVAEGNVATLGPRATREITDSSSAQAYLTSLRAMYVADAPIDRGAQAADMDKGKYALLRERVLHIYAYAVMRGNSRPAGFTDDEYDALEEHRTEIVNVAQRLQKLGAF